VVEQIFYFYTVCTFQKWYYLWCRLQAFSNFAYSMQYSLLVGGIKETINLRTSKKQRAGFWTWQQHKTESVDDDACCNVNCNVNTFVQQGYCNWILFQQLVLQNLDSVRKLTWSDHTIVNKTICVLILRRMLFVHSHKRGAKATKFF